jgi:hypothetical protein
MKTVTIHLIKLSNKLFFTIIANLEKIGYAVGHLIQPCKTRYKYKYKHYIMSIELNKTHYLTQPLGLY